MKPINVKPTDLSTLKTPEKIVKALKILKEDLGWKYIVKVLESQVKATEEKLHGSKEWDKSDTLTSLQDQRNDRMELIKLPDTMIDLHKKAKAGEINLDPYE